MHLWRSKKNVSIFQLKETALFGAVKITLFWIWTAPCENMFSGIHRPGRQRSAYAYTQSDQDLHRLQIESLDTTVYMNGEQRPG